MQTQETSPAVERNGAILHHAAQLMQNGAAKAAAGTEKVVRRYPFPALGIALGTGIIIGAAARHLLEPQRPRSVLGRLFGRSF